MSNFAFLSDISEYALFAPAAVEAEKVYASSPAMCAVGTRKALELAVKWVFSADDTMEAPYKDNLSAMIHEPSFRFAVDYATWSKLPFIVRLGNLAVHTERAVSPADALASLKALFEFIEWLDYCYGATYVERHFDAALIPTEKVIIDTKKIKEQESLLEEKAAEIEALRKQVEALSAKITASKNSHQNERHFVSEDISEFETRKRFIDVDLKLMGWQFDGPDQNVRIEFPVNDMEGIIGKLGYVDYVLFGKDGLPLAVVEAKKTIKDERIGRTQAILYADCLERRYGRRPFIFMTNGFSTRFWDSASSTERKVSGIFGRADLQRLMNRRKEHKDPMTIPINLEITGRHYQESAIRAICGEFNQGYRKFLLVMATGTGKTRTACSIVDVFSRANEATNVLFLADRTALVRQAKDAFREHLPEMSLCNLCENKDDINARIVFSTYPTILRYLARKRGISRLFYFLNGLFLYLIGL